MNRSVQILGTGYALPKKCFLSSELDKKLGLPLGKFEVVDGVFRGYFVGDDEHAASLAVKAAKLALSAANVSLKDIECLVFESATLDKGMSSIVTLVHQELGLAKYDAIPDFDTNYGCMVFLAVIDNLSYLLEAGRHQRILLVASDLASCGSNWNHLESSAIFGDGAVAVVLSRAENESDVVCLPRHSGRGLGHGGWDRHRKKVTTRNDSEMVLVIEACWGRVSCSSKGRG